MKHTDTSSIVVLFDIISGKALVIRSCATYSVWFWASLLFLSCDLHTSCPNRQTGSGWFLLVLADWSMRACTVACWIPEKEDTVSLYVWVTQLLFTKAQHMLGFETCACTMQRAYYTKPWCVVLCNHCISRTFCRTLHLSATIFRCGQWQLNLQFLLVYLQKDGLIFFWHVKKFQLSSTFLVTPNSGHFIKCFSECKSKIMYCNRR